MPPRRSDKANPRAPARRSAWMGLLALAAVVMGAPTLAGRFVGADDETLVLNNVLVNHPSLTHAVELLRITHRDLYQPLPLLMFSGEFLIATRLNLFTGGDPQAGAWFFHLNNILLHALNAVLVFVVVRRLSHDTAVAIFCGLVFAVHPLQVEVVAWINGRMMLLSTLFALASIWAMARHTERRGLESAALVLLLAICCAVSKVRVGLPVLLLMACVALPRTDSPGSLGPLRSPRVWGTWLVVALATALFVAINVHATSEQKLFEGGATRLLGPRPARVALTLAQYFRQLVYPAGLCSWYPAPPIVRWTDAETLKALAVVLPVLGAMGWAFIRVPRARAGLIWFWATIASTLPIFPARNILAADRYLYLPVIGLLWALGAVGMPVLQRWWTRSPAVRRGMASAALVTTTVMIGTSWHNARFYENALLKTQRMVDLYGHIPGVWTRLAWAYFDEKRYEEAIAAAEQDLAHVPADVQSQSAARAASNDGAAPSPPSEDATEAGSTMEAEDAADAALSDPPVGVVDYGRILADAYEIIGWSRVRLGQIEEGLAALNRAVAAHGRGTARYRLAIVHDELGNLEEAVRWYESALRVRPNHVPAMVRAGRAYQKNNHPDQAREMFERALTGNAHEVPAIVGLAELDIHEATPASLMRAVERLESLLKWMPENSMARTNLGVACFKLGRVPEALAAYERALRDDPANLVAAINAGMILHGAGNVAGATGYFDRAARAGVRNAAEAEVIADFYCSTGAVDRARRLWQALDRQEGVSPQVRRMWLAWCEILEGRYPQAAALAGLEEPSGEIPPDARAMGWALRLMIGLFAGDQHALIAACEALTGDMPDAEVLPQDFAAARRRTLVALERFDAFRPDDSWTFYAGARLLAADGRTDTARLFAGRFLELCPEEACAPHRATLAKLIR